MLDLALNSILSRIALFAGMIYVFLWVPDLDLRWVEVLHHRSILTHSILPAFIFLIFGFRTAAAPMAGALIGLGVHLSCDLLSPMVGYGQIWLPAPFKTPLGWLSYLWLFANAWIAFMLARIIALKAFGDTLAHTLVIALGGLAAVAYGWENEGDIFAIAATALIFSLSFIGVHRDLGGRSAA